MKTNILAICDRESMYVNSLTEYINENNSFRFQIEAFSGTGTLMEYVKKQSIEILLIAEDLLEESITMLNIRKIIIIAEDKQTSEQSEYPSIYKYQSADSILKELLHYCEDADVLMQANYISAGNKQIIGVFSPVSRIYKTSLAISIGQLLAKERKVLYINMEEYSGFSQILNESDQGTLSDLLYLIEQEKDITLILHNLVQNIGRLDYIPTVLTPIDISDVKQETWSRLIEEITNTTEYEVLILDMGNSVNGIFKLLKMCSVILTPYREDFFSNAKMQSYEKVLQGAGYEYVLEKTKKFNFTNLKVKVEYLEQLLFSEIGEIARDYLKNEWGSYKTET